MFSFSLEMFWVNAAEDQDSPIEIYVGGQRFHSLEEYQEYRQRVSLKDIPSSSSSDPSELHSSFHKIIEEFVRNLRGPGLFYLNHEDADTLLKNFHKNGVADSSSEHKKDDKKETQNISIKETPRESQ